MAALIGTCCPNKKQTHCQSGNCNFLFFHNNKILILTILKLCKKFNKNSINFEF